MKGHSCQSREQNPVADYYACRYKLTNEKQSQEDCPLFLSLIDGFVNLAHLTTEETGNPPPEVLIENEGRVGYHEWLAVSGRKVAYLAWEILRG